MRRFAVGLLIFFGAFFAVMGNISNSARHQILDTNQFVAAADQIVATPAVQDALKTQLTDAIMSQKAVKQGLSDGLDEFLPKALLPFKDTIKVGAHQGVEATIGFIVDSDAFKNVINQALTVTHDKLVSGQGLTFDLGDAKSFAGLNKAGGVVGQAAKLLPNDIASVSLLSPAATQKVNTGVSLLKNMWWWMWLLGIGCFVGAVLASHRRRKTLRAFAVTAGVIAGVFVVMLLAVRSPVLSMVPSKGQSVATAIWDTIVPQYTGRLVWLIGFMAVAIVIISVWGHLGLWTRLTHAYAGAKEKVMAQSGDHPVQKPDMPMQSMDPKAPGAGATAGAASGGPSKQASGTGATAPHVAMSVTAEHPPVQSGPPQQQQPVQQQPPQPQQRGTGSISTFFRTVGTFIASLNIRAGLEGAGHHVTQYLSLYRGGGVVVGALFLLLWPSPTLGVALVLAALVALYLGGIELLLGLASGTGNDASK